MALNQPSDDYAKWIRLFRERCQREREQAQARVEAYRAEDAAGQARVEALHEQQQREKEEAEATAETTQHETAAACLTRDERLRLRNEFRFLRIWVHGEDAERMRVL